MSNVIKANPLYSGTDQPGVIGKIYEQLFDDSSGNTMVRYLRCFKAGSAVTAGQLIGCDDAAGESEMHTVGTSIPVPDAAMPKTRVYGVALATVASGSYGFCVCRGVVSVSAHTDVNAEGKFLATYTTDGMVQDDAAIGAGASYTIVGISLAAQSGGSASAYINVL
tara:strand:+ start:697 stop:1194 length:498 start_codon:yes stop_codon:yes gene_type:complete